MELNIQANHAITSSLAPHLIRRPWIEIKRGVVRVSKEASQATDR